MMKSVKFAKIDAFASSSSSGNPAAVVYLDAPDELSDDEMLQLAKELKGFVSEVGYVYAGTDTDYRLRYFSPEREIAFCGHATIAILNDILANNKDMQARPMLSIETQTDHLMAENRYGSERSVYISAPLPEFSAQEIKSSDIASALNCGFGNLDSKKPIQIVSAGLKTLVVPMSGLDAVLFARPDFETLNQYCRQIGADIVILYTPETAVQGCGYRTRVFTPTLGYLEDHATGSGNSALGYYLMSHGMWDGGMLKIEQNDLRYTPNFIQVFARQEGAAVPRVWFGGGAVKRIDGQYILKQQTNTSIALCSRGTS
jgi:PhzF family phenazine biosynthesis protein